MFQSKKLRALRAAVAGVAGAALLGLGFAGSASASVIDAEELGSITVYKHTDEAGIGAPGNGVTDPGLDAETLLDGITFQVSKVNAIDLSTNAGWGQAATLADAYANNPSIDTITGAGYSVDVIEALETGSGAFTAGQVVFSDLPVGLYYVEEAVTPGNVVPAAPFLITVPLTHPTENNAWIYDVVVYPKNSVIDGDKTVVEGEQTQVGDTIEYTITGEIPSANKSTGYHIYDELHENLSLNVDSLAVGLSDDTAWTAGVEYEVVTATDGGFHIRLTQDGLDASFDAVIANPAVRVQVDFTAVVETAGEITNTANIYPNNPKDDPKYDPEEPEEPPITPETVTKFGGIDLLKQSTDGQAPLPDAEFQVWYIDGSDVWDADAATQVLNVPGGTWTTGADGKVLIDNLRYSDWANGDVLEEDSVDYRHYWLIEVSAPEGHELLAAPVPFEVTGQAASMPFVVDNVPSNAGFNIPLTGGAGTALFTIAGLLLVGTAGAVAVRNRRQEAKSL